MVSSLILKTNFKHSLSKGRQTGNDREWQVSECVSESAKKSFERAKVKLDMWGRKEEREEQ